MKKIAIFLVVAFTLFLFVGCTGSGDSAISLVKNGKLDGYQNKTLGEAFDSFMPDAKWESLVADDGNTYVNVKGTISYYGEAAESLVQYLVDKENNRFEFKAMEIDGQPQTQRTYIQLISVVYGE